MSNKLSLSAEQIRQLDAVSATLRIDARDRFRFDVIRHLELNFGLRSITNDELQQAITACIGVVRL